MQLYIFSEVHYSNEEGVEADEGIARKGTPEEKPTPESGGWDTGVSVHLSVFVCIYPSHYYFC